MGNQFPNLKASDLNMDNFAGKCLSILIIAPKDKDSTDRVAQWSIRETE